MERKPVKTTGLLKAKKKIIIILLRKELFSESYQSHTAAYR